MQLTNGNADFATQLPGVGAVGLFVGLASTATWLALKSTIGIRLSREDE